ncbi:imidazolonepropionase [Undibacterium sp. RTI2.1]|uniref:imidazolonepropionase n=1 Tax=unclassified Undibacterium TaxID=2630295 RepID=UPI002AB4C1F3|nr:MULTISPECIES: imidazolonepropionase [unclassified Undibacterium]MDY7536876.1 imidazolonepropionase [Undibacterium sp. 5I1]MEB0029459.1 imidazolonepropionase [Undibacterium sp. RTI2.1]MEB0115645.1 imidazolonepropionase [Undibacterium sp. RTI2.2]MEB0230381.1 imidazolonepropionase [Undibacterium sp. 10I3]MEB0256758.1 imidazolonepropionase [Undibacterium sp. 5I1]
MLTLWTNVHLATMQDGYGEIRDAAIVAKDGKIVWLGKRIDLSADLLADFQANSQASMSHDGQGCWLTPGLIDCHTHIVYAGNRSDEFEARLNGVAYEDIARQGGGILSTVRATRAASPEQLMQASLPRVRNLLKEGVTTLEIKSGYGLDVETEAKMLRVARQFAQDFPVRIKTTFLGAHALPPEYAGRADDYLDLVCNQMLPALVAEGLVDAVDAFCEKIGFSPAQTEKVFQAAQRHGLPVKLHAEQLSDQGGTALTARYQGLSADHLEYLSQEGINAMAQHGTVAVLLPGAYYFLRETKLPPVAGLREAQVPIAISTDCNPGTSPMTSLLLAMNMACTLFRLTPLEALAGVTKHAARALGLQDQIGTLEIGKAADFALWAIDRPGDLAYAIGGNPCVGIVFAGEQIVS